MAFVLGSKSITDQMRTFTSGIFFFLLAVAAMAQHPTCNGNRYQLPVFASYDSTMSVKFGENTTYGGTFQELFMDVYEPAGDVETERPVVVLAFGGAFISGQRSDMRGLCRSYARAGYVAATIDYRLFDNFLFSDTTQAIDAVIKAVSDMKAAIRFLRENATTYGIDTNYVFAGGVSAGAIAASHAAYLEPSDNPPAVIVNQLNANGGYEGNSSTNFQYSSRIQGVLNWSGALKDASWIDANDPPLYMAHDDADNVVPYSSYSVQIGFTTFIYLEGSATMKTVADGLGIYNNIFIVPNSTDHVSYFGNSTQATQVALESADLMYNVLCNPSVGLEKEVETTDWNIYPNPTEGAMVIENSSPARIALYDLSGKLVLQKVLDQAGTFTLDGAELGKGMYILRAHDLEQDVELAPRKVIFQ